jgi:hypothetical protein
MDDKDIIIIAILVFLWIGLLGILAYLIPDGNLIILGIFLALFILGFYPFVVPIVRPQTNDQVRDLRVKDLILDLPYDEAFAAGKEIIYAIDAEDVTDNLIIDSEQGIIFVKAIPEIQMTFFMKAMPSHITLSFRKKSPVRTHLTISVNSSEPLSRWTFPWGPLLARGIPSRSTGLNEQYMNRIANFLLVKSRKPPVMPEPGSQEVYRNCS